MMPLLFCLCLGIIVVWLAIGFLYLRFFDDGEIGGWLAMIADSRHGFPVWVVIFAAFVALLMWPEWIRRRVFSKEPSLDDEQKTQRGTTAACVKHVETVRTLEQEATPPAQRQQIEVFLAQHRPKDLAS